jgi:phenylpropionate dioxygenase-like ring-hydroxylating dioxygenase large terminal subunit
VRTCRVAEVQAPATETPAVEQPDQQRQSDIFSWTKTWYAVAAIDNLDPEQPNKFTLLGKDYVLWCDAKGEWHCFEDRCPHRLATLSDGIVHRKEGTLVCAYHGWEFKVRKIAR